MKPRKRIQRNLGMAVTADGAVHCALSQADNHTRTTTVIGMHRYPSWTAFLAEVLTDPIVSQLTELDRWHVQAVANIQITHRMKRSGL